jgi:hypothetical protein
MPWRQKFLLAGWCWLLLLLPLQLPQLLQDRQQDLWWLSTRDLMQQALFEEQDGLVGW